MQHDFDSLVEESMSRDVPSFVVNDLLDQMIEGLRDALLKHVQSGIATSDNTKNEALLDLDQTLKSLKSDLQAIIDERILIWSEGIRTTR